MNVCNVIHRRAVSEGQLQHFTSDPATSTPRRGVVNYHDVEEKKYNKSQTVRTWVIPEKERDDGIEPHEDQPLEPIRLSVAHGVVDRKHCRCVSRGERMESASLGPT